MIPFSLIFNNINKLNNTRRRQDVRNDYRLLRCELHHLGNCPVENRLFGKRK